MYSQYTQSDEHTAHADWTPTRSYDDPVDDGSFALAMNDANMSVGQAIFAGTPCAALFQITTAGGDARPKILLPPKGTSWVGTATGINASGIIVGYEVFGNGNSDGRAVRFFEHGNAVVLPVGAAGASTSAQAINVHGDIVAMPEGKRISTKTIGSSICRVRPAKAPVILAPARLTRAMRSSEESTSRLPSRRRTLYEFLVQKRPFIRSRYTLTGQFRMAHYRCVRNQR